MITPIPITPSKQDEDWMIQNLLTLPRDHSGILRIAWLSMQYARKPFERKFHDPISFRIRLNEIYADDLSPQGRKHLRIAKEYLADTCPYPRRRRLLMAAIHSLIGVFLRQF